MAICSVEEAVEDIRQGRMIILVEIGKTRVTSPSPPSM